MLKNFEESEKEIQVIEQLGKEFYWYANFTRLKFLTNTSSDKQINLLENFLNKNDFFMSEKYFELANLLRGNKNYIKQIKKKYNTLFIFFQTRFSILPYYYLFSIFSS